VTLDQFSALCDREWANGRGDVVGLRLTDGSYGELAREVLAGSLPLDAIVNPVTRSAVKVASGASADLAEVTRYYARATEARADQDFTISRGRLVGGRPSPEECK
jgi:hypothetical protein